MEQKVDSVQSMKTLECDKDLHRDLKIFAIQMDLPMKQLTEQFLREGMERHRQMKMAAAG